MKCKIPIKRDSKWTHYFFSMEPGLDIDNENDFIERVSDWKKKKYTSRLFDDISVALYHLSLT